MSSYCFCCTPASDAGVSRPLDLHAVLSSALPTNAPTRSLRNYARCINAGEALSITPRPIPPKDADLRCWADLYKQHAETFPDDLLAPIAGLLSAITRLERPIFEFPEIKWDVAHLTLKEQVDLNRFLTAKQYFHAHEERVIADFKGGLAQTIFKVMT